MALGSRWHAFFLMICKLQCVGLIQCSAVKPADHLENVIPCLTDRQHCHNIVVAMQPYHASSTKHRRWRCDEQPGYSCAADHWQ